MEKRNIEIEKRIFERRDKDKINGTNSYDEKELEYCDPYEKNKIIEEIIYMNRYRNLYIRDMPNVLNIPNITNIQYIISKL
jgi:hypothetical protein